MKNMKIPTTSNRPKTYQYYFKEYMSRPQNFGNTTKAHSYASHKSAYERHLENLRNKCS